MKKLLLRTIPLIVLLITLSATSFSQQTTSAAPVFQNDYLKKSKNQKKAARIMLGGGGALVIGSIVWAIDDWGGASYGPTVLFWVGSASMIGSIPLFIASGKNKKRANAASVFLDFKKVPVLQQAGMGSQSFPVLGLKISL
jgi:hypothetical protein